jgi:hypothetical protein
MPRCSCKENVLGETKPCESHKKCANPIFCKKDCCPDESDVDCCSPAYLRLEKLRTTWAQVIMGGSILPSSADDDGFILNESGSNITTSSGENIPTPCDTLFQDTDTNGIALAEGDQPSCGGALTVELDLAYAGYLFVNSLRYSTSQECGKKDQVYGWLVDTATENLEVFQDLTDFNLTTQTNRLTLLEVPEDSLSRLQKKQLIGLNVLYKLSLRAIAQDVVPRREGNIVSVTDKSGQNWTIAINNASSTISTKANTQFVVIATPAC